MSNATSFILGLSRTVPAADDKTIQFLSVLEGANVHSILSLHSKARDDFLHEPAVSIPNLQLNTFIIVSDRLLT